MSAILLGDKIVHYEVLGRGRPVIFLHGWIGSWRYWLPTMQTSAAAFRAYALDLWGFGDTARASENYPLNQQAALVEQFLEKMGIGKVALIGHGLGALVSLSFTHQFPDLVDRVMVSNCPLEIRAVHNRLRTSSPTELADWLLEKNPVTEPVRADVPKTDPRAIAVSFQYLESVNLPNDLTHFPSACLLVHGQNDPAVETPTEERIMAMPENMHQVTLEQSGHFPMLDESAKFHRLMSDLLSLEAGESPRQLQLRQEWKRRVR